MVDKVIRDGKVAVLYSPGFGAGWSTWAYNPEHKEQMVFCPALVFALEKGEDPLVVGENLFPDEYLSGLKDLKVFWIPMGERFRISEYDGSESIELLDQISHYTA